MADKELFVSVDIDSLDLYLALYGRQGEEEQARLVSLTYERGVTRFLQLFDELGISATFFVVGKDLEVPSARSVCRNLLDSGQILGNHTWSHPYRLTLLDAPAAKREILGGHEAIGALGGGAATIFRAPGYNMTNREYAFLAELGYRFDASPLPSYPYVALKYLVMAGLAIKGRKSHSIWGNPLSGFGQRKPHERMGLTVLPCATTAFLRLPVIGTTISVVPEPVVSYLQWAMERESFVGLEFHAVDLMGLQEDSLPASLNCVKDLHLPVELKMDRYRKFMERLLKTHHVFVPGCPSS